MKSFSLFSLAFFVACGPKAEPVDSGEPEDTGSPEEYIVPEDGMYSASLVEFTQDECQLQEGEWDELLSQDVGFQFTLSESDFYVVPVENGEPEDDAWTCYSLDENFICPIMSDENESDGLEAVFVLTMDLTGEWVSNTDIVGSLNASYTCRGKDCADASVAEELPFEIPCATKISFAGAKSL